MASIMLGLGILLISILATNSAPIPDSQSGVDVVPKQLSTPVGSTAKITCSIRGENNGGLIWTLESRSDATPTRVYNGHQGFLSKYKRYSIDGSCKQTCTLMIKNMTVSDAGTFTCALDSESGSTASSSANLTVIGPSPECKSRPSVKDIVMDNDCDVLPDSIEFECSVICFGIDLPEFAIISSNGVIVPFKDRGRKSIGSKCYQTFFLEKITSDLNGIILSCQVQNTDPNQDIRCDFPEINLSYFFKPAKVVSNNDSYSCYANTSSQQCTYSWIGNPNSTERMPFEGKGQLLKKKDFGIFDYAICLVKCQLRSRECQAESDPTQPDEPNSKISVREILSISGLAATAVLILIIIIICIYLFKKRQNSSRSTSEKCSNDIVDNSTDKNDGNESIKMSIQNPKNGSNSAPQYKTGVFSDNKLIEMWMQIPARYLNSAPYYETRIFLDTLLVELVEMIGWKMFALMLSSELKSARDKDFDTYESCRKNIKTIGGGVVYQFLSNIYYNAWRKHPRRAFIRKFYTKFLQRVILIHPSVMTESFDGRSMFLQVITTEILTEEERKHLRYYVDSNDRTKKLLSYITENEQTKIERFLELVFIFRSHVFNYIFSKKELPNLVAGYMREHLFKIKENLLEMKLEAPMTRMTLDHPNGLCPLEATKMVDLLLEKSCINASQRQFIEEQPDDRSKAEIITDLFIHGCEETFFKTVVDYLGDTEQIELYYSIFEKYDDEAIEEDGTIPLSSAISQIACSENKIYALCDEEKVLDVYDDNQELCGTIKVPSLGKSYGITYYSGCSSIIISDCENNYIFQIIIPEKALIVKTVEGLSRGISTTMSDDVLVVVQEESIGWKNRIDVYRANAASGIIYLVRTLIIPETIQFVQHASQTSEGRFVISCKTNDECFIHEISETPTVRIARTFVTFSPSISQQLPCIPDLIQVDEYGRIIFHDTTSISRVFILYPLWLESDLQVILPNNNVELDEPLGLCYRWKNQRLIVHQKTAIRIFKLRRRI